MNISNHIRSQFKSLHREYKGKPLIYMDGPGGTQIPDSVVEAMDSYYATSNTNTHGFFPTSKETDKVIDQARESMADFLNAEGPDTISFGQNMTTLNFSLVRGISRILQPGDEVLITQLDHEANRGPWLSLREFGVVVREVDLLENGTLDYDDFEKKVNEQTRIVAVGCASNAIGTVNNIPKIRELTYKYGAWLALDAVHFAPHFKIDVQDIGCEFLFCSAYKFYGPHVGVLYAKPGTLDRIPVDNLRTQEQMAPYKIETGTLNHAALAGVTAAVDFIAFLGEGSSRKERVGQAMEKLAVYENKLARKLYEGFSSIDGVTVVGLDFDSGLRAPTVSILVQGARPEQLCEFLGNEGICAWDGHFYAIRAIEVLGLLEKGGVTRFGISAYTKEEEIERVVEKVKEFAEANAS
jgi:cysteine desulfurase family protein (TIGR01976 family)